MNSHTIWTKNIKQPRRFHSVRVDRRFWLRGQEDGELLTIHGYKCCLGFACEQVGIKDIHELCTPEEAEDIDLSLLIDYLVTKHGEDLDLTNLAIGINDNKYIEDEERETRLKQVFTSAGHHIEFIN